jgi:hypothetical protein
MIDLSEKNEENTKSLKQEMEIEPSEYSPGVLPLRLKAVHFINIYFKNNVRKLSIPDRGKRFLCSPQRLNLLQSQSTQP